MSIYALFNEGLMLRRPPIITTCPGLILCKFQSRIGTSGIDHAPHEFAGIISDLAFFDRHLDREYRVREPLSYEVRAPLKNPTRRVQVRTFDDTYPDPMKWVDRELHPVIVCHYARSEGILRRLIGYFHDSSSSDCPQDDEYKAHMAFHSMVNDEDEIPAPPPILCKQIIYASPWLLASMGERS